MSYFLIIVISSLIATFDSAVSTVFIMLVFDPKKKLPAFFGCFFPRLLVTIFKYIYISDTFSLFMALIGTVGTMLIIYLFYDSNLPRGLTKTLFCELVIGALVSIESLFTSNILGITVVQPHLFYPDMFAEDITAALIEKAVISLLYIGAGIVMHPIFKKVVFPNKVCIAGAICTILFAAVEFVSGLYFVYTQNANMSKFDFYITIAMIVIFALIIKIFFDSYRQKIVMRENANLRKLNAVQYEHYEAIEQYNDEIRRMRHDITNHLHTMQILLNSGENDECRKYTDDLITRFSTNRVCFCENKIIDAVVYNAASKAAQKKLDFETDLNVPNEISISQTDMVSIFANLLDNAVEAADGAENGSVSLSAAVSEESFVIKCRNSCSSDISYDKNGIPITSKKDTINHGLGTKIISSAVDNYGGSIIFDSKDNIFSCIIMIPLTSE